MGTRAAADQVFRSTGPHYKTGPYQGKDKSQQFSPTKHKSYEYKNQESCSITIHSLIYIKTSSEKPGISTDVRQSAHASEIQVSFLFGKVSHT